MFRSLLHCMCVFTAKSVILLAAVALLARLPNLALASVASPTTTYLHTWFGRTAGEPSRALGPNQRIGERSLSLRAERAGTPDVAAVLSAANQVVAGNDHTCVLTTGGGVKCWGWNQYGQLGDGTLTNRATPVDVSGLASGVTALAVGGQGSHTCALMVSGGVKCWGWNAWGQLGNGTLIDSATPVDVSGLSGVAALAVGSSHTCALTISGGVKCWGYNWAGQLGNNMTTDSASPVDVSGLASDVTAVAAGGAHTCALTTAGGVKCWGWNGAGQLGDATSTDKAIPVDVSGLASGVTALAAGGRHTCAVTTGGGVKCWGWNVNGQLGNGTTSFSPTSTPVSVSGLASGGLALAAGGMHTCALMTGGGVKCWGWNANGQLGDGTTTTRTTPVDVNGLASGATILTVGEDHACILTPVGDVECWGENGYGQLGDGTLTVRTIPVAVNGLASGVIALAAGKEHICALTTAGGVKCWGWNAYNQLGDGTVTTRMTPVAVSGLASGVLAIAAGGYHTCALTTAGGVKCWGYNSYGQLGDSSLTNRATPVNVSGLASGVLAIAAGGYHTCALTTGGGAKCWGWNMDGQVGNGVPGNPMTPVDVSGLASGVQALSAGERHTCALTTGSSAVKCWGYNTTGQLGDGTSTARTTPVAVSGLASGGLAIAAGWSHTCALTPSGGVRCWGHNSYGQLGDGTTTWRFAPVDVSGYARGVLAIAAGERNTCALTTGGGVVCWGSNEYGQLGVNPGWTPVDVVGFGGQVTYSVAGRVVDGNGDGIVSVLVSVGAAGAATTNGNGDFSISRLAAGTYTLTPSMSGYTFTPASLTITVPPDVPAQNFVATPIPPVVTAVEPTSPATIILPSAWGQVSLPAGLVDTPASFTYTEVTSPAENTGGFAFTDRSFTIEATDANGDPITTFDSSFTITLDYQDSDWQAAGIPVEENLNLNFWNGTAWTPVLPCAGCSLDTVNNRLTAVLDHLTEFAILGNPRAAPAVSSSKLGNSIKLTWPQAEAGVVRYEVYRSTDPYTAPGAAGSHRVGDYVAAPGLGNQAVVTDAAPFGSPSTDYYYVVLAVGVGEVKSPASNRVGVVNFTLTPGTP